MVSHLCPPRTMQRKRAIIELASFHSPPVVAISNLHVPAVLSGTLIRGARATVHPGKKPLDLPVGGSEHVSRRRTAGRERVGRLMLCSPLLHHPEELSGHAGHFRNACIARTTQRGLRCSPTGVCRERCKGDAQATSSPSPASRGVGSFRLKGRP
jgi:hypothetical protein